VRQAQLPGPAPLTINAPSPRLVTEQEKATLFALLARKGKNVKAALKSVGSQADDLASLTVVQFQDLMARLENLPDRVPATA
jgi:hypothetical protein